MRTLLSLFALQLKFQPSSSFSPSASISSIRSIHSISSKQQHQQHVAARNMATSGDNSSSKKSLVVDPFCFRQFAEHESSKTYGGTIFSNSMSEFETIVNTKYDEKNLVDGYAPFCKHIFIPNDFTNAQVNVLPITAENQSALRTSYERRNELELPVLTRFFSKEELIKLQRSNENDNTDDTEFQLPVAKYLDLILYSRQQIQKENDAMKKGKTYTDEQNEAPWGIVSIKAQDVDYEIPMTPITAMRNALGKEEGGSGVPLDRESYLSAFEYWDTHATIS